MTDLIPSSTNSPARQAVEMLAEFGRVLRRRSRYPIAALALAVTLGVVYYVTAERTYEATSLLQVIQSRADLLTQQQAEGGAVQNLIPTQERLLTSPIVLENALLRIQTFAPALRIDFDGAPPENHAKILKKTLSASGIRQTDIVQVRCRSKSPAAAEALLGAVVEAYLGYIRANHKDFSAQIVELLERERGGYESQLRQKESQLLQCKLAFGDLGLRSGDSATHPAVQRVLKLNEGYLTAQGERIRLESLTAAVELAVGRNADLSPYLLEIEPNVGRDLLARGLGLGTLDQQHLAQIEQETLKDRAKLANLSRYLGESNPEIQELKASIESRQAYVASFHSTGDAANEGERARLSRIVRSTLADQLAKARAYEAELAQEYAAGERDAVELVGKLAQIEILEHEAANLRRLNDVMLDRIAALDIGQDKASVRTEVVGRPHADPSPVWPALYLVAFASVALGLGAGAALAYVHDLLDDRFRSPEELEEHLGVPTLAVVRKLPPSDDDLGADGLLVHARPQAVECEAFRTLRTTLSFSKESRELLAVTSSEPSDGKTTVVSNLGVAYSQAGKRTLLIDADMRRPGLSRFFEMRGLRGLSEVLRTREAVESLAARSVQATGVEGLFVLPSGAKPGNPSELLSGARLAELLQWALEHYDQVLIDCPPAMAGPDASIVASHADGLLLVVSPHKNRRRTVARAVADLRAMAAPLVGVVANQVDASSGHGYYGYGYGYGYGEAYGADEEQDDDFEEDAPAVTATARTRVPSKNDRRQVAWDAEPDDDVAPRRRAG
ncbi:MAG TPA: polysaccharide biosynthesis tyrosine autokinase [Pirellulaceae bacterium]|jgi:capsular exopolysaccharide synthesis family protein|nr:polysaccharide biosynthesis tyrosine autokinase [Pirellulaceae bacterium]